MTGLLRYNAGYYQATLEDAADTLGISVATLWRKRKRYGIE